MFIKIELDTENSADLAALTALISALGASSHPLMAHVPAARTAPPPPPPAPSDQLMAHAAAARVEPASDDDGDEGEVADATSLDPDGIPWDARIHASTKTKNKDGRWKKLKGVNEVTYGQVFAELQQRAPNSHTGTVANGAASNAGGIAPPPPASPETSASLAPPPPPPAAAPTASVEPAATIAVSGSRFPDFASFVQSVNAIRTPGIPYMELNQLAEMVGITGGFKDMREHPSLWETYYAMAGGQ